MQGARVSEDEEAAAWAGGAKFGHKTRGVPRCEDDDVVASLCARRIVVEDDEDRDLGGAGAEERLGLMAKGRGGRRGKRGESWREVDDLLRHGDVRVGLRENKDEMVRGG